MAKFQRRELVAEAPRASKFQRRVADEPEDAEIVQEEPVEAVPKKIKREPFKREYTREVQFGKSKDEIRTYGWRFTEYKKPDSAAPQHRLLEERWVWEGADILKLVNSAVSWEMEMQIRMEAYVAFLAHVSGGDE